MIRHRRARRNSSLAPQLDRVFEAVNLRVEAGDPRPDLRMLRDAMAFELSDVIGSKYAKAGASDSRPEAYLRGLLSAGEGMIAPPTAPATEKETKDHQIALWAIRFLAPKSDASIILSRTASAHDAVDLFWSELHLPWLSQQFRALLEQSLSRTAGLKGTITPAMRQEASEIWARHNAEFIRAMYKAHADGRFPFGADPDFNAAIDAWTQRHRAQIEQAPPAPRTRRPRRGRGESVAGAVMGAVVGRREEQEEERQRVAAWKLETPIYAPLEDLLAPWKPWARSQLARVRKGADPEIIGWGVVNGVEYVTNGHWLMPGYKGPKDEIEFKRLNPRSFRFAGDMTDQMQSVMETRGLREIFVSFVPEKKDIQSAYHWPEAIHTTAGAEMQINPRYLAMAVYAVGPNAILLQESNPQGKILVRGDKGEAIIMPMRATL